MLREGQNVQTRVDSTKKLLEKLRLPNELVNFSSLYHWIQLKLQTVVERVASMDSHDRKFIEKLHLLKAKAMENALKNDELFHEKSTNFNKKVFSTELINDLSGELISKSEELSEIIGVSRLVEALFSVCEMFCIYILIQNKKIV